MAPFLILLSKSEIEYFAPFYKLDKPIMVIQPCGGPQEQPLKYNWVRDIPPVVMKDIISSLSTDGSLRVFYKPQKCGFFYVHTFELMGIL